MRLGIEASNIRDGGGLGHLRELLCVAQPAAYGIQRIAVWAGRTTLDQLPSRPWLEVHHDPLLDQSLPARTYWQVKKLPRLAQAHCDCLFVPGGLYYGNFKPVVTLSQNMLPFEWSELQRYGLSGTAIKFWLLRLAQAKSFRRADGAIFLTQYAQSTVRRIAGLDGHQPVIPLGVSQLFFQAPRVQKPFSDYSLTHPFKLLYVSKLEPYKHHVKVITAIAQLRREGLPVTLQLVGGPERHDVWQAVKTALRHEDEKGEFIYYTGHHKHEDLPSIYQQADGFVFASSCENLPTILLEAMAAGLPIACAQRGPMPEVLGQAGLYFDPEQPSSIASAVRTLLFDQEWRTQAAHAAHTQAQAYSWERCAHDTFSFLVEIANRTLSPQATPSPTLPELSRLGSSAK